MAWHWTTLGFAAILAMPVGETRGEERSQDVICGLIEHAAAAHGLPSAFLTRLIWRESSFRPSVRSGAGAQGIAQFMPGTAASRGLSDPFDPEAAIPASAAYLAELRGRFGNLGLAAAAYNAGPTRIARWRAGDAALPAETRAHVRFITGSDPEAASQDKAIQDTATCSATLASIRAQPRLPTSAEAGEGLERAIARWGVQLVANRNKATALSDFAALQKRYGAVIGDQRPTILTTRLGGRGKRSFYRVRIAFDQKRAADGLCRKLRAAGGTCLTVAN